MEYWNGGINSKNPNVKVQMEYWKNGMMESN
jgi:hypothetical protein